MRKRKDTSTIIRQFKYSVSTDQHPLPAQLWDVAKRMQQAWNALIPAYADSSLAALNMEFSAAWNVFRETHDEAAFRAAKALLNKRKREEWIAWEKHAKEIIRPFELDYSQAPNVIERFNGCIKANRTCHADNVLTHVQIPFVFPGSAAIPVESLYDNMKRWRIVIEGYSACLYDDNTQASRRGRRTLYLELGLSRNTPIKLRLDFHRPLPPQGRIKRVLLCGQKIPLHGWRWHVLFQVEMPVSQTIAKSKDTVSLRICWTRVADGIVVAQWKDSVGEGMLRLPLNVSNHQDRRTIARRPDWNDWIVSYPALHAYQENEFALQKYSEQRLKMRERRIRIESRWQARRRWLYRNFAVWLVKEYSVLRIPILDIKSIAEDQSKIGALAGGNHWRQIAAPGDLLAIIKETAEKHGRVTEKYSQTSMAFHKLTSEAVRLRYLEDREGLHIFDTQWNSRAVAEGVHAG